ASARQAAQVKAVSPEQNARSSDVVTVIFTRRRRDRAFRCRVSCGSRGIRIHALATSRTDAEGHFVLGDIALRTELEFLLETSVRFEYAVGVNGRERPVDQVQFVAP